MSASKSDVGHNWAHQRKEHLTSGNFRFDGDRIYSYSTVIGQIVNFPNKRKAYFVNNKTYSSSTSKHQVYMNRAIPSDADVFPITPPTGGFIYGWHGYFPQYDENWWKSFVYSYCGSLLEELGEFSTSRKIKIEHNVQVYDTFRTLKRFCEVSGLTTISKLIKTPFHKWAYIPKENFLKIKKLLSALKENEATPLGTLVDIVNGKGTYDAYVNRTKGLRKERCECSEEERERRREKAQKTRERKRQREYLARRLRWAHSEEERKEILKSLEIDSDGSMRDLFHKGIVERNAYFTTDDCRGGNVLLRYNKSKRVVETTKGIDITITEAKRLWKLVSKWHENQASFTSGEVAVTNGYSNGWEIRAYFHDILHSGCHSIAYEEMRELAESLKFSV